MGCLLPFFAIAAEVRKRRYIALTQGCKAMYYLRELIASAVYSTLANPGKTVELAFAVLSALNLYDNS